MPRGMPFISNFQYAARDLYWGPSLLDAGKGNFDVDTESWTKYVNNQIANDAGALKITYVDNPGGAYIFLKETSDILTDLIVGKTYRIRAKCKVNGGSSVKLYISGPNISITDPITSTEFTWYEGFFVATHATTNRFQISLMAAGEIIWIDQFIIQASNN